MIKHLPHCHKFGWKEGDPVCRCICACPIVAPVEAQILTEGDTVRKIGGDYTFEGTIVAEFTKLSGAMRYVVEDDRGVLHIYSAKNLEKR